MNHFKQVQSLNVKILKDFIEEHNIPDNAKLVLEDREHKGFVLTHSVQKGFEFVKTDRTSGTSEEAHLLIISGSCMKDFV